MAGVMDSVNQRTQLVGQNRLELLLFRLDGKQLYGINVFKVREVLQCPKLTIMPKSSPVVCGVANIRGATIPILDLALATGSAGLQDRESPFVIITEYNTKTQGFLVRSVERIVLLRHPSGMAVVLEQSTDMVPGMLYSRLRPGLNHMAFRVESSGLLAEIAEEAQPNGWSTFTSERHAIAGGAEVVYLEDRDGFEVELVAFAPA